MSLIINAQTVERIYHFDNPQVTELRGYQQVAFDGTMQTAVQGQPSLPYQAVSLLLPQGAEAASIEVELSDFQEIEGYVNLFPYQPSRTTNDITPKGLIKDEALYASRSIYPSENHGVVTTQYLNGFGFAFSSFTPVQYVPATGRVMFAKTAKVRINLASAKSDNSAMLWKTNAISKKISKLAQNPEMMESYNTRGRDVNNYDLLIITGQNYLDGFEEYVNYYDSIGVRNEIVTVEEIYSSMQGRDNQEKVRNYIIQEYQNNGIELVVLGGDVNIVPYRGFYCDVLSGGSHQTDNNIPADLYYAGLDGTWNDNNDNKWGEIGEDDLLPEVGIGRLSFSDATKQANMINKSLRYQRHPVLGEFRKETLAGEWLYDNPQTYGSDYLELLIGEHSDNGYTTNCIPENYNFTKLYAEEGNWSHTNLENAINSGMQYVHHVGHANTNFVADWYNSDITSNRFSGANGVDHNYTFFHSHGCICGSFEDDCIMERMISIENFAVCAIGNSRYGWFNEGQTEGPAGHLEREMCDAQFNDRVRFIGCQLSEGKCMTAPFVTAPGQWEEGALRWNFYDLNVLGDGAVTPWLDEPFTPNISIQGQPMVGMASFNVEITDEDGNPQENFKCIVYNGDEVLSIAFTNDEGIATMVFDGGIQVAGELTMTVNGTNAWPQRVGVIVVASDTPYIIYDSYELAGGVSQIDFGTENAFNLTVKNVGSVAASNVTATLSCESEFVTINESTANVGNLDGNQSVTLDNVFAFSVSDSVPDNTTVRFNLSCTNGTDTWESHFDTKINAIDFQIVSIVAEGENGDAINPGESGIIHFTFKNNGGSAAPNATFVIFNQHEGINIEQTQWQLDEIGAGEEFTVDVTLSLSEDLQEGAQYELPFGTYYCKYMLNDSYFLSVGNAMEDFETGDFSAFDWHHGSVVTAWEVVTEHPYEGMYCAKSSMIDDYGTTSLYISVEVTQAASVSFYYKVSSEASYDKLHFYIDGNEMDNWSGEVAWTQASYTISAGTHTLKWEYTKDVSYSSGSDCAWIDNVVFPPTAIITDVATAVENRFDIYPNPAEDVINIELGENASDVVIYNSLGQMVKNIGEMIGNVQISISELNAGMYFVKVGGSVVKIVKR